MTPLRLLIGSLVLFAASYQAQARDPLCPPDPNYHCPPGFVRPGPDRPPIYNPRPGHPGLPGHGGPSYPPPAPPYNPPPYYPPYNPPPYNPPPYNPPQAGMERREIFVGRYMQNERMDLNMFLDRNIEVQSVEISTNNAYNTYANLNLLVDRRIEDSRSGVAGFVTLFPRQPVVLDLYSNRLLSIEVNGQIYVDRIVVNFRRSMNQNPGGYDLSAFVNRSFQGFNSLDIGQIVNLYQYRGYRVTSVIIQGSSMVGRGQVEVLANSFSQSGAQILPTYSSTATFFVSNPSQIGFDLNSLVLQMHGNITIERVIVRVVR